MKKRNITPSLAITGILFILLPLAVMAQSASNGDYSADWEIGSTGANVQGGSMNGTSQGGTSGEWSGNGYTADSGFSGVTNNVAPIVTILSPTNESTIIGPMVTIAYSATDEENSTLRYEVGVDGGPFVSNTNNTSYQYTNQSAGSHTYRVRAIDADGTASSTKSVTVTITSLNSSGTGNSTQTGFGLLGRGVVQFKGIGESCTSGIQCEVGGCLDNRCSECSQNDQCSGNETCRLGACVPITGSCGEAIDHAWNSYACCSNLDCQQGLSCNIYTHSCVPTDRLRLEIQLTPEKPVRGESTLIRVTTGGGELAKESTLFVNGDEQKLTDGSVIVVFSDKEYDLVAVKQGFESDRLIVQTLFSLYLEANNQFPKQWEDVTIVARGSDGEPVSDTVIELLRNGQIHQVFKTNAEGESAINVNQSGEWEIVARKDGYADSFLLLAASQQSQGPISMPIIQVIVGVTMILAVGWYKWNKNIVVKK